MMDTLSLLKRNPVQLVAIGLVVAIVIGVFAYVAGYLTPRRLSASRIVEAMRQPAADRTRDSAERMRKVFALPARSSPHPVQGPFRRRRYWAPRCFTPSSAGTASCKAWSSEIIARLCRSRAGR